MRVILAGFAFLLSALLLSAVAAALFYPAHRIGLAAAWSLALAKPWTDWAVIVGLVAVGVVLLATGLRLSGQRHPPG